VSQQPVVRKQPWTEPRDRFTEFAAKSHAVWLDTVAGATGYSILAAEPSKIIRSKALRRRVQQRWRAILSIFWMNNLRFIIMRVPLISLWARPLAISGTTSRISSRSSPPRQ
jgi:hypothetical protein